MTPEHCPKCDRNGVYWNDRHSAWMCHMLQPACNFWETEREHTARLRVSDPQAPEAPLVPDDRLYVRCPTCAGSRQIPGAIMNSLPCACAATPHVGFVPFAMPEGVGTGPATPHLVNVLRTDHARLLVALWDVAMVDDESEAAYLAASHVHGRSTSVWLARKALGLSLPDINEMELPDHEGKKAERDERAAREPEPDGPPTDAATAIAGLRAQHAATDADRDRLLVALYDLLLYSPLGHQLRPPQAPFAGQEAEQYARYSEAQRAAVAVAGGRGEEVEAARAATGGGGTSGTGLQAGVTFADLAVGDHFVRPADVRANPASPVGLVAKIAGVPSTKHRSDYYNTQDHATGAVFHTPPATPVVPVSLGDFGKRERPGSA